MELNIATTDYVDKSNELIFDRSFDGDVSPSAIFQDERLKGCKSVLITLLSIGAYNFTFEITDDSSLLNINGSIVYFSLNKKNGTIALTGNLGSSFMYNKIFVRR